MLFQSVLDTIINWCINQVSSVVYFILMVLFFSICLYLTVNILQVRKRTGLAPEINFFGRSIQAILAIAILLVVLGFIFLVLLMTAFMANFGANNILGALAVNTIGGFATSIFSSNTNTIILVCVLGIIILLFVGEIMKTLFHVPYFWGILISILTVIIGAAILWGLEQVNIQLTVMFTQWGQSLEEYLRTLAFPPQTPTP
jgi:hypothetical protein